MHVLRNQALYTLMTITPPYKLVHPGIPQTAGDNAGMFLDQSGDMVMAAPIFDLGGAVFNVKHPKFGAVGDGVTDDRAAIALAVAAIPATGGILYFPPGIYVTTSANALLSFAGSGITVLGAGRGATILRQLGTGNGIDILGSPRINNIRVAGMSIQGNDVGAKGIDTLDLGDGIIEEVEISGFLNHCIDGRGAFTLHVVVRDCRFVAGVGALAAGRALNVRFGTSWRAEYNYFNIGGTVTVPQYDTAVDVRDHDQFISIGNIWDGAVTGMRTTGKVTSIGEYWDLTAPGGITGNAYELSSANHLTVIAPRAGGPSMVNFSGTATRADLTFIGVNDNDHGGIAGITFTARISPPQIIANQNDFTPTGGLDAGLWRLTSDAVHQITGIAAGATGQHLEIVNIGTNPIGFRHNNVNSVAANRILAPDNVDFIIREEESLYLVYDLTTVRWRVLNIGPGLPSSRDVLTPPQITVNQNNFAPTGAEGTHLWRISSDAARTITGITAVGPFLPQDVVDGHRLTLANIGAFVITLSDQSVSSTAANRIITGTGADRAIAADTAITLVQDKTSQRWRWVE